MRTKKKSYAARLGALALALTLVTTCLLGGTLARYVTEVTSSGTAEIAKWEFKVGNTSDDTVNTGTYDLTLKPASYTNVTANKVAPGTKGSFAVYAENSSETAATYTITFTAQNKPANLKFYQSTDGITKGDEIPTANGTYTVTTDKALTINAKETTYVIWDWGYSEDAESDQATIATGSYDMTVNVKVVGTQAMPTAQ